MNRTRHSGIVMRTWAVAAWLAAIGMVSTTALGDEPKGKSVSYREAKAFLAKHTQVLELSLGGARLAICPAWQGRVMTSTCDGLDGMSFGFINREFIEAGKPDLHFANYGAEDRMWLSPEGGQFSLWFKPGAEQNLTNWFTAPAMNEGPFEVVSRPRDPFYRMKRRMQLQNASATDFDLDVTRDVRLLTQDDLVGAFGAAAAGRMANDDVKMVAYETVNTISNRGPAMSKEKGLVSIWMLGMMNCGPKTVVMVPYKAGDDAALGPVVKSDYFGPVPPERLKVTPAAILFMADANYRSKIGTSQKRAKNVLGSIDFDAGVLTLVQFTMPDDPTKHMYLNNMWELPQKTPFEGDVANSYNDGPPAPGKKGLGAFYEIESLSPAKELGTSESLTHRHRTVHIRAETGVLAELAKAALGVDLDAVRREMFP